MAAPNYKNKKKKFGLLSAMDIIKGYTALNDTVDVWTQQPLQCIPQEIKDENWKMWNADWHEAIALRELPKKAKRIEKLYNLAAGIINKSDYIPSTGNEMNNHLGVIGETEQDVMNQFFPIAPIVFQVFMGEFIKRDHTVIANASDPETINEKLEYKEGLVNEIITSYKMFLKNEALKKSGIIPTGDPKNEMDQKYQQEIQTEQQLIESEEKFRKFRTIAEDWANKFIEKFGVRNGFDELELNAFADSLIADEVIIALNLRENDFDVELLQPKKTYVNISDKEKYYSKSNFIVNIDFYSISDIINTFRNDLTAEQVEQLEQYYNNDISSDVIFSTQNGRSSTYYDKSQSYDWNMQRNPAMVEEKSAEIVKDYFRSALYDTDSRKEYSDHFNDVKKIRVTRVWWPSQRMHGLLTKIEYEGATPVIEQVDENFLVTEEPEYDNTLTPESENSAANLIKGEHIEWKYATQWRYIVKIGRNIPNFYKLTANEKEFKNIYLYGDPIKFQFMGNKDIYESKPPVEGCKFSNINNRSVGLIESIKSWQITYNILNNKGVALLPKDLSKVLVLSDSSIKKTPLLADEEGVEPLLDALDNIRDTSILNIDDSKDAAMASTGRFMEPKVVDMSTVEAAAIYFQAAQAVKGFALESIGVSPQRASQVGKSESATGVNAAVEGSVNQTELRFELFSTYLIPRVWQMILDAAQFYTVQSPEFSDIYLNSQEQNALFSVLKDDLLLRKLFVNVTSKANIKKLLADLKQLTLQDNTMGATYLDKVKSYLSKSPNELITGLQKAEDERKRTEQSRFEEEQQTKRQQQELLDKQKRDELAQQDKQFNDNLANQRYIAELKSQQSAMTPPPDDSLEQAKMAQTGMQNDALNEQNSRKIQLEEQKQKDSVQLKREEFAQKDRDNQSRENIAIQNKSYADLKFQQLQKAKAASKK